MAQINGISTKIDACKVQKFVQEELVNARVGKNESEIEIEIEIEQEIKKFENILESVLSTRVPDETFRGLINFVKILHPNASYNEIEKALVS